MKLAALGCGTDGLGGLHDPVAWAPAIDVLADRLRRLANMTGVLVVTDAAPGFGLMVAVAAYRVADERLPVVVDLAAPWPTWPDGAGLVLHERAVAWYHRAMARAGGVAFAVDRPPTDAAGRRRALHACAQIVVEGAGVVWTCGGHMIEGAADLRGEVGGALRVVVRR